MLVGDQMGERACRRGAPDVFPLVPSMTVRLAQPAPAMEAEAMSAVSVFTDARVRTARTVAEAERWMVRVEFDLAIIDLGLPDGSGVDVVAALTDSANPAGYLKDMRRRDPTLAEVLKPLGYRCGQFGKNHLGDRDAMLPTAHGFDEFFGNLYHLNAEDEPENPDYPKSPEFKKKFGPRGVIHSFADGRITDTGPLTRKRMETVDEEVTVRALEFMERARNAGQPFFLWWNSTRMHVFTHLKPESEGKTGLGIYADGMAEHDGHVGKVLDKLKELGLEDKTIVMYSSDNGAETFTWPDGGTTMFRGEKNTQFEGGYRVPTLIKWPGTIKPGTIVNEIGAHEDMMTTVLAAAGDTTAKEELLKGRKIGDTTYKVHLDSYDQSKFLTSDSIPSAYPVFILFNSAAASSAAAFERLVIATFIPSFINTSATP